MPSPGAVMVAGARGAGALPRIVKNRRRIAGAGIAPVMGPDALAGNEVVLTVAIEIGEGERVGLARDDRL